MAATTNSSGPVPSSPPAGPASTSNPTFPFALSHWKAVDDRVRGGSSVSHLDAVEGGVKFWGTLDTQTLGGAGFASQSYTFDTPLSLPLSHYTGLVVKLAPRSTSSTSAPTCHDEEKGKPKQPTRITVVLKTETPAKRKDGRNEAVVSWEADFDLDEVWRRQEESGELNEKSRIPTDSFITNFTTHSSSSISSTSLIPFFPQIRLPFPSFIPTYRGRPVEPSPDHPSPRLDPSSIVAISLMCRSNFGEQEGDFECLIKSLKGVERGSWRRESARKRGLKEFGWGAWLWALLLKLVG